MGEWILQSACLQNRAWQDAGLPRIRVVVNLSSRQLKRTIDRDASAGHCRSAVWRRGI